MPRLPDSVAFRLLWLLLLLVFILSSLIAACSPGIKVESGNGAPLSQDTEARPEPTKQPPEESELPGSDDLADKAVPQLSPDRKHLLRLWNSGFALTEFPTGKPEHTFPVEGNHRVIDFGWAPGGDAFAYHTEHSEPGGSGGVYIARVDGSTEKLATLEPPKLGPRQMVWSPCGRYLFWDQPFSIHDRNTGETLIRKHINESYQCVRSPLFVEGGSRMAFTLLEDDGSENLWVMDIDQGSIRQVTDADEGDYPFFWMNDSTLLVRIGAIYTGGGLVYGLASVDVETGSRAVVDMDSSPSISPDGPPFRRIHVVRSISPKGDRLVGESRSLAGDDSRVYLLDLASGQRVTLLEGETPDEGFAIAQALWMDGGRILMNVVRQSYGEELSSSGSRYRILEYSGADGFRTLAESATRMQLLGVLGEKLYYLELDETGSSWQVKHVAPPTS
ncbi:MAG: hypothetical protein ACM3WU_04465 [Bacillota bacterium]